jgi:DNA-binding transcriptional regulator/RsmH inhibitor MraZ
MTCWEEAGKPEVFITTFDEQTARIYFMPDWQKTKAELLAKRNEPSARTIFRFVNYYGEAVTMDGQGRFMLPTTLRRKLGFENQQVQLLGMGPRIEVHLDAGLQDLMAQERPTLGKAVDEMEAWGIG